MPFFLARAQIPGLDVVVDPCAAILVFIVTGLLCVGIKEVWMFLPCIAYYYALSFWYAKSNMIDLPLQSSFVQAVVTVLNVCVMLFVVIAGGYVGFKTGWVGYSLSSGYRSFPNSLTLQFLIWTRAEILRFCQILSLWD